MKALAQQDPHFEMATNSSALPSDWPVLLGSAAKNVHTIGPIAPQSSTAPGVVAYLKNMKAMASADTLNYFSEMAWASWYPFAQAAATVSGDLTAASLTTALSKETAINTEGITPGLINYTEPLSAYGMTRVFGNSEFLIGAQNGVATEEGAPIQWNTLLPQSQS
jgi:hypothetical protein